MLVGQNLNKTFKEISKELSVSSQIIDNHPCLIIQFSDNISKWIYNFQETFTNFMQNFEKSEAMEFSLLLRSSIEKILEKTLESPVNGLLEILNDSTVSFSGFIK